MTSFLSRDFFSRFFRKILHDVLPAALASAIGGFLFAQIGRTPPAPQPVVARAAGEDMVRMLHDEHALIIDFMKQQADAKLRSDAAAEADAKVKLALAEKAANRAERAAVTAIAAGPGPAPARVAAKPADHPEKRLAAVVVKEPLQITPVALTETQSPSAAPVQPKRPTGVVATAREWTGDAISFPGRVWSAAGQWISDLSTPKLPPLPIPNRQFEARM
ncbi:MAG TPA: hypothetical protein VFB45_17955 [Pseudolabrys sp.]|nr:hypothetical protein [Pseudolabrys sp.]